MSFFSRAQKAYDRGDKVRAVVTLIEGLKRDPEHVEALDFLLRLYGVEVDGTGLELDVVRILEPQPDANDLLSVLVDNARACGNERVADALLEMGETKGLHYVPAQPEPDLSESVSSHDDDADQDRQVADTTESRIEGESQPQSLPQAPGPADRDEVELDSSAGAPVDAPEREDSPIPDEWLDDIDGLSERSVPEATGGVSEDESAVGTDSGSVRTKRAATTRRRRDSDGGRRFLRKRVIVPAVVVLAIGIAGFLGYGEVRRVSAEARVEAVLTTTAPHRREESHARLDDLERPWRDTPSVQDRLSFTRAYLAWSVGEELEPTPIGKSPWATGSLAIAAAQRGDLEEALEMVTRAERTDAAAIPSLLARAIVEEERQRWSASDRSWSNVLERDPDVVAAHEGRARNAWRRFDDRQLHEALAALGRLDDEHPYLALGGLEEPFGVVETSVVVRPESRFLESLELFRRARVAFARGDYRQSVKFATELSTDESSGIAALQMAVALAHDYQPDQAMAAFERAALTEGTTRELRLRIQALAPEVLVGIGRPDLSERFETTLPGKTPRESAELRLPALRRSAIESVRESPWAARAMFAHVDAVAQRGDFERAIELYEFLEGREVDPDRARWEAALLALSIERKPGKSRLEGEARAVWKAASDYLDGEFEQVNVLTGLPTDGALGETARRYQILSLIASQRDAVALQLLDEERGKVSAEADGLRLRAYGRQARENARFVALFDKMHAANPVGVLRASDLAAAAFWQGRVKVAAEYADATLALQPEHRQANWIKGLILRQRGDFGEAESFLRKSGRDWDDTAGLLIELGYVSLALENWDEARKSFYKAFLKNRENIESVRGLGMAYAATPSEIAVRDLSRIESGLPRNARFSPIRGEVLRWLAVVEGVREGKPDAMGYLEGAIKEVGRRPDLLVEKAKFHEARGERGDARKLYATALQGNTTLASAHLGLARTALRDGDESVARDHLERYLEVEPRGPGATWARKRLASLNEEQ